MTGRRHYAEGEDVLIGSGGFGRNSIPATVSREWSGEGMVWAVPAGRTKPRPYSPSRVRPAKKAPPPAPALVRKPTTEAGLRPVPRPPKPERSPRYLRFVRSKPCCACQTRDRIEAHHWAPNRGMGQKVSDFFALPLCVGCHDHFHDHGALPRLDARTTREVFLRSQVALLKEWVLRVQRAVTKKEGSRAR